MKRKIYFILAVIIALMPLNIVRVGLYRFLFNYKLESSKIGWLTILNINTLYMTSASIGSFNIFTGPMDVKMALNSRIGLFNYFKCGAWAVQSEYSHELILEHKAGISIQHYFDVAGRIYLGKKSIIAGVRSQFWTHGGTSENVDIYIGDNCYIGSGTKFSPGTKISDDSLVAMGSVVTKEFEKRNVLIAGVPAKIIREEVNWKKNWK